MINLMKLSKYLKSGLRISSHIELNELLVSSIGPLALFFNWKKRHKEEFSEIASGALASSFIHGDPIGTITSIVVLAYRYNQSTNKQEMRNLNVYY